MVAMRNRQRAPLLLLVTLVGALAAPAVAQADPPPGAGAPELLVTGLAGGPSR